MKKEAVVDSSLVSGSSPRSPPSLAEDPAHRSASHGRMEHQTEPTLPVALAPSNDNLRMVPHINKLPVPVMPSSSPSPVYTHTEDDAKTATTTMKLESTSNTKWETLSTTSSEQPICRICHDSLDENGKSTLVSPCGCTGSAQFTHRKCLQKWTSVKGATTCEICHKGYKPKFIRLRQKLLTRQVMCMGSAASLPLLIVIIVGFFLLGEQLSIGTYGRDNDHVGNGSSSNDMVNGEGDGVDSDWDTSRIMVAVCMITTATFGIFLLCCFSVWAAHVQPQQIEGTLIDGGLFGFSESDVERNGSEVVTPPRRQRLPSSSPLSSPSSPLSPTSPSSPSSSSSSPSSPSMPLGLVNIPVFYIYD